jgi:hypothetical protein
MRACCLQDILQHIPWPAEVQEALGASNAGTSLISTAGALITVAGVLNGVHLATDGMLHSMSGTTRSMLHTGSMHRVAHQQHITLNMGLADGVPEDISPDFLVSPDQAMQY